VMGVECTHVRHDHSGITHHDRGPIGMVLHVDMCAHNKSGIARLPGQEPTARDVC
jgi:hypothetical protein